MTGQVLTQRQRAVLALVPEIRAAVAAGEGTASISARLGVSVSTIKRHGGPCRAQRCGRPPEPIIQEIVARMVAGMDEARAATELGMPRAILRDRWRRAYRKAPELLAQRRAARQAVAPPPMPRERQRPASRPAAPKPPVRTAVVPAPVQRKRLPPPLPSRAEQIALIDDAIRRGIGRRYEFAGEAWQARPILPDGAHAAGSES